MKPAAANARWVHVFGPRRFSWGIKVGLAVASTLFLVGRAGFDPWLFATLLAAVGWGFSYRASMTPTRIPDPVVEGENLVFGDKVTVPLADIVGAYRVAMDVEIETRSGDRFTVNRYTSADANAFLEALGFGGRRRVTARLATTDARFTHLRLGFIAFVIAVIIAQFFFHRAAALQAATVLGLFIYELKRFREARREASREVHVGNDCVSVDGERGAIALLKEMKGVDRRRRDALVERFGGMEDLTTPEVRRRYVEPGPESYRNAAPSPEEAAAVMRSPDATKEERIGAAVALRASGESAAKIRVLAGELADDDLRAAIEEVAASDDEGLRKMRRI